MAIKGRNCAKKEQLEENRGEAYIFIKNKKKKREIIFSWKADTINFYKSLQS